LCLTHDSGETLHDVEQMRSKLEEEFSATHEVLQSGWVFVVHTVTQPQGLVVVQTIWDEKMSMCVFAIPRHLANTHISLTMSAATKKYMWSCL
jgi:hypothetical protein